MVLDDHAMEYDNAVDANATEMLLAVRKEVSCAVPDIGTARAFTAVACTQDSNGVRTLLVRVARGATCDTACARSIGYALDSARAAGARVDNVVLVAKAFTPDVSGKFVDANAGGVVWQAWTEENMFFAPFLNVVNRDMFTLIPVAEEAGMVPDKDMIGSVLLTSDPMARALNATAGRLVREKPRMLGILRTGARILVVREPT